MRKRCVPGALSPPPHLHLGTRLASLVKGQHFCLAEVLSLVYTPQLHSSTDFKIGCNRSYIQLKGMYPILELDAKSLIFHMVVLVWVLYIPVSVGFHRSSSFLRSPARDP